MTNQQMELTGSKQVCPSVNRRQGMGRANWWFARMREAVDRAFDWQPTPPPPPEQIWFNE
jgi:hypothetical protein